jgi:hypothetical protein
MAFLDNSGDIILDAVLTDAGRKRLSAGDGSFKISKFALGDDEIDYSLYTPITSSGYEDLRILQLPVFEAFTNNTTVLKNKLLTYQDDSLLYLPVIKLNNMAQLGATTATGTGAPLGGYYLSVDSSTTAQTSGSNNGGIQPGYRHIDETTARTARSRSRLVFDQGLDSADLVLKYLADTNRNLLETQYIIEVDNRLLSLASSADGSLATPTFIDDDSVASYYFSLNSNPSFFASQPGGADRPGTIQEVAYQIVNDGDPTSPGKVIGPTGATGRLGSRLVFSLRSSADIQANTSLFTQLGSTATITDDAAVTRIFSTIDTVVRVTGFTTGYRMDVPVKLLKYVSTP